jgi:hypothetical protein
MSACRYPDESALLLKFNLSNTSPHAVARPLIEVTILGKAGVGVQPKTRPRLAGPFLLRADTTLEPGFTMTCELLLCNLTAPCDCDVEVSVVSVR